MCTAGTTAHGGCPGSQTARGPGNWVKVGWCKCTPTKKKHRFWCWGLALKHRVSNLFINSWVHFLSIKNPCQEISSNTSTWTVALAEAESCIPWYQCRYTGKVLATFQGYWDRLGWAITQFTRSPSPIVPLGWWCTIQRELREIGNSLPWTCFGLSKIQHGNIIPPILHSGRSLVLF